MQLLDLFTDNAAYVGFMLTWAVSFLCAYSYGKVGRIISGQKTGGDIKGATAEEPVSVILTVRNQAVQLRHNLPFILEQDYENFEVIVVNDASDDDTEEVLQELEMRYPHLHHSFIPPGSRHISHKRLCLTVGFKAARNEWILLTEPDCRPQSVYWLRSMSRHFRPSAQIVLGYANYILGKSYLKRKTFFFNLYHQLQYLPWATRHKAYRCNPANLAYRRSFFMSHKGFADDVNLLGGAAELLVNRHSTPENTEVCFMPESKVLCGNISSARQWKFMRNTYMETRRHFKHAVGYRLLFNLKQLIVPLFYCCATLAICWSVWLQQWTATTAISLLTLLLFCWKTIQFNRSVRALNERPCYLSFWWFELRLLWWHCCSWLSYRTTPRDQFYRKAF